MIDETIVPIENYDNTSEDEHHVSEEEENEFYMEILFQMSVPA